MGDKYKNALTVWNDARDNNLSYEAIQDTSFDVPETIREALTLATESEQLRKERDELFTWQNNARHAKAELDLERIRLQDIIRDMEAKLDKAKWQPIETARPYTDILMMVMLEGKYQKCQVASFVIWEDKPLYADWHWQPPPTHWMPLPDAPEQP